MAKKKDFTEGGGLEALFSKKGGAKPTAQPTPQEQEPLQEEATLTGRGDILSSIEDAELRAALRAKRMEGRGRPRKGQSKESLTEGYIRATTIVNAAKFEQLKGIALQETLTIKEVIERAFDLAITTYKEKGSL